MARMPRCAVGDNIVLKPGFVRIERQARRAGSRRPFRLTAVTLDIVFALKAKTSIGGFLRAIST
ncbi:hypothetical protein QO004_000674 [Rhizobium mesoamericanum]|nr:hypothetical protein [Rhizobium mesoamericanum]